MTRVRVETSSRLSLATKTFSIEAMVRGYHVYQDSWDATIREQSPPCKREPGNHKDLFAVAAVHGETVSHVPKKILSVCSMFLLRGATIEYVSSAHPLLHAKVTAQGSKAV